MGLAKMLVERGFEFELLDGMFADAVAGRGRVALISGGLASGRTELLQAFAEQIADRGALLLTATGARVEQVLRMGVVWQLFQSGHLPAAVRDRLVRLIGEEPSVVADADVDPVLLRQTEAYAVHGVCALLLELAEERPVVIAVDDVQFVDEASLQVLLYLRRRMRSAKLLLVLTEWERPHLARPPVRADVTRQPHRRISLGPLSPAGVTELLARRLGPERAARSAAECHALTGGNPFLTQALIDDQQRRAGVTACPDGVRLTVGAAFREAVLDALHRWDPEFLRVAGALAVLGEESSAELVGELIGIQPHPVNQVLDMLTTAGLVEGGRLRGSAIADTVLESLAPEDRSRLHARVAELRYRHGSDALEVARHLVAAGSVPGPWAVPLLRHAADQVLVEEPGLAVRYLELAMRAAPDEPERVGLRAALVRVAWRVNPSAAARHLPPLDDALTTGALSWPEAVPVIRHLLWQGDLDTAARRMRAVHASVGAADPRTAAELRLAGEWIYGRLRDRIPADVYSVLTAAEEPENAAASPWRRTAALNSLWGRRATGELVGAAEHILQGSLGDIPPEVGAAALLALDYADRSRAMYWCEALSDEATRQSATTWQAMLHCVRADIAWRRGDLTLAQAQANAALDLLHTQSWGVLIGLPLSLLILVNTAMGAHEAAAELLDRAVPEAMLDTVFGLRYLHASGHYNLATGRPLAALDNFERCRTSMRDWGLDVPAMVPWRSDLAQAYLKLGMRKEARDLIAEQLDRPHAGMGPRTHAVSLRVLAACSEPAARVEILREAVQILERCADRLELARALMDLSQAHRELGDLGDARLVLRRADQVAKACQAQVLPVEHPRRAPERGVEKPVGERATESAGLPALSEAERKVAELAAHGHTNREIGRKLYITVSTVEQHLTRVYRKLNVSKRSDLLSELPRYGELGAGPVEPVSRVLVPR